jgi:hypothetical protein
MKEHRYKLSNVLSFIRWQHVQTGHNSLLVPIHSRNIKPLNNRHEQYADDLV